MFPEKDEKGTTANQTLVISWTFRRRRRLFRPLAVVMISASRGDFPCLFIMHAATARDRESRRFNRDGGTSRKAIIHGLRSLHFCAGALNGFDIPWWITTTKWGGERRWGGQESERARDWREKSRRSSLPELPRGAQCVGGVLYVSLASVSPLFRPRESLKPSPSGGVPSSSPGVRALVLHTSS